MHKWQKDLWAGLTGMDPKEMKIIMNGRQIGKSTMAQMWMELTTEPKYEVLTKATVDDDMWYTVKCHPDVSLWLRTQPEKMWHEHIDREWTVHKHVFDIHEKIHTMLHLKYGDARV